MRCRTVAPTARPAVAVRVVVAVGVAAVLVFPSTAPVLAQEGAVGAPDVPAVPDEQARAEAQRLEAERLEAERLEAERLEAERLEAERVEAERLEAERRERERVEQEAARTQTLRDRLAQAREDLARAEQTLAAALGRRNQARGDVVVAGHDLEDARDRLARSDERIAAAERAAEAAGAEREVARERFAAQVARAYRAGTSAGNAPMVAVDALLRAESPRQFVDGITYLDSVLGAGADRVEAAAAARQQAVAEVRAAAHERTRAEEAITDAEAASAAARSALPGAEARLDAAFAAHAAVGEQARRDAAAHRAATLDGDPHPHREQNVRLADELRDLVATSAQLVARMRAGSDRILAGEEGVRPWRSLVCPVDGPVHFLNDWGFPRTGGRSHEGTDIFAERGTPVLAMAPGVVRRVSRHDVGLGGLSVTYEIDGYRIYNAHLDTVADGVEPGAALRAGQVVGTVGTTGNAAATPPHNHLGLSRPDGAPVNPYPLLRRACG